MGHQAVQGIHFNTAKDKASVTARLNRGAKVSSQASKSAIYAANPDVKSAADTVAADTDALKAGVAAANAADAAAKKARSALAVLVKAWDTSFGVLVATGQKRCVTADDGTGLGMDVRSVTHN